MEKLRADEVSEPTEEEVGPESDVVKHRLMGQPSPLLSEQVEIVGSGLGRQGSK